MSEHILTVSGNTGRFVVTDGGEPTLTDRYRPLPASMNSGHVSVARAHQVSAGDVVVALFSDDPGTRHAEHVKEAFTADPRDYSGCPERCDECKDIAAHGVNSDR
ncbi:hypothetical protein ACWCQQ_32975 [Streptomyces sp. NPDC002143]